MRVGIRTKILVAILLAVLVSDALAAWAVNDRLLAGSQREAASQTQARAAQVRALLAERAATLAAEGEAVSLYPAVIAALAGGNAQPLLLWSGQVNALQGTAVTVTDAKGRVIARGHAPTQAGDDLSPRLAGLRLALGGQKVSGVEGGDELGLALRGYAPVRQNGAIVGAVMIADPLDARFLGRLVGGQGGGLLARIDPGASDPADGCAVVGIASGTCRVPLLTPDGQPVATLALTVPLADVARAREEGQRALGLTGAAMLALGALAAWLLAGSLARPLARLATAAHRIAGGDYERPVAVRGSDEIGALAGAFEVMRARVAATTRALRKERDVQGAVLESAGEGILLVDPMGCPVLANRAWADLLGGAGLEAAAALAQTGAANETFSDVARAWLASPERIGRADFERRAPYGRFRFYTAPVRERDGPLLGRIFVVRDVTQESEAERMRSALIATVSHELRAPLTAIVGYTASLLHDGPWEPETEREFLGIIAESAAKLAQLIDSLLDAAVLEAGVLRLAREPVRVEALAHRLVARRGPLAPDHVLRVEAEPGLPLADADPARVEQVLANLVENAIKYSPAGGTVTLSLRADPDRTLRVDVRDQGIGIAPRDAERLFERFYRVDNALARATKGVGLGLFICKGIVEAHGGRIAATSAPGEGSTFTFTLPRLAEADDASVGPGLALVAPADG